MIKLLAKYEIETQTQAHIIESVLGAYAWTIANSDPKSKLQNSKTHIEK